MTFFVANLCATFNIALLQCPTTIVPFFGDQMFWGERVHARGVGPAPIPADQFTLPKLIDAIQFMVDPKVNFFCSLVVINCDKFLK